MPVKEWAADSVALGPHAESYPALSRSVLWLWQQQGIDGRWHSQTYGPLQDGEALTPLVIRSLQKISATIVYVESKRRVATIERSSWGDAEHYPTYADALTLYSLADQPDSQVHYAKKNVIERLLLLQYTERNGFASDHPAYGGWGYGGAEPVGESPGHMDLGHTRHVLQALRAAGHDDPQTYARAEKFLRLLQKQGTPGFDGGFYFSPIVLAANKGGEETIDGKSYFRSYATATCDGILALLACGVKPDDERITSAVDWLKKHPRLDYPEGVLEGTDTNWGASIRYYHFAVRAECYRALDWPGDWRGELRTMLAKLQQPDGSFVNREGFLMKEDDPILCTARAGIALSQ